MPYLPNIPQPNDTISGSQNPILQNFQALNTEFGLEHQPFATGTGKHSYVTLQRSVGIAPAGTDANLSQQLTAGPSNAPYIRYYDTTGIQMVMTARTLTAIPTINGISNVYDFATNTMPRCAGTVVAWQEPPGSYQRTLLSPFLYDGTTFWIPGTAGQVASGGELVAFRGAGTVMRIQATVVGTVTVKIMYSPL